VALRPLALALAKTDMWEGHAGQTQANPVGFGIHLDYSTCLHVTVLFGIPGICRADRYMRAAREFNSANAIPHACSRVRSRRISRTPPTINSF
jgi:hypothetical protein